MRCYVPGLLLALPVIMLVGSLRLFGVDSAVWLLTSGALALAAAFVGGVFILNRLNKPSTTKKKYMDNLDCLSAAGVNDV